MPAKNDLPSDALERCHQRWVDLFFGILRAIWRYDRNLALGVMLAFQKSKLADFQGDALSFIPNLLDLKPSDEILRRTGPFRQQATIPPLRGRIRRGRLRPPYYAIHLTYYRYLYEERAKDRQRKEELRRKATGEESPSERAKQRVAKEFHYPLEALKKHLERAQKMLPELTNLWRGEGAEWIESQ